jgi:5-methylcytosine-specific restriction endonuclease McrA
MIPKFGIRRRDYKTLEEYRRAYQLVYKKHLKDIGKKYSYARKVDHNKLLARNGLKYIFKGSARRHGFTRTELLQLTRSKRLNCEERSVLYWRNGERCEICMSDISFPNKHHIDHIVPLIFGGEDTFENSQIICVSCHREKTAKETSSFYRGRVKNGETKKIYKTAIRDGCIFDKVWRVLSVSSS